jgi:protein arginine kinase activator
MAKNIKCHICGKPATVHLTQILDNKIHKVDLCEVCAKEKGITDPEGFSLVELLTKPTAQAEALQDDLVCEKCGFTPHDFKKFGRFGCPSCYDRFGHLIKPMLKNMHKDVHHKGKIPDRSLARISIQKQMSDLEQKLQVSIKEERYEDAALIRDEIRKLKEHFQLDPTE